MGQPPQAQRLPLLNKFQQHFDNSMLSEKLHELDAKRLPCHCTREQRCHADLFIDAFASKLKGCYDSRHASYPPLKMLLELRWRGRLENVENKEQPDEPEPDKHAWPGWVGHGPRVWVGTPAQGRDMQNGGERCSPGLWHPSIGWTKIAHHIWETAGALARPEVYEAMVSRSLRESTFSIDTISQLRDFIQAPEEGA